jgi:Tfp pilus assembly PilM family ATPase
MKNMTPTLLGLDIISTAKLLGVSSQAASFVVAYIGLDANLPSAFPVAIALTDSQLLQKTLPHEQALDEYESTYALDHRLMDKQQILMTAVSKSNLQIALDKVQYYKVSIVDSESACVQRCLQQVYSIDVAQYLMLIIDQTELRFYYLPQGKLLFKYRELLTDDFSISVQRTWRCYRALFAEAEPIDLYLMGSNKNLSSLVEIIQQIVQISVHLINPFEQLYFPPAIDKQYWLPYGPAFVVACGLALRGCDNE